MPMLNEEQLTSAIMKGDASSINNHIKTGGTFGDTTLTDPNGYGRNPLELAAMAEADNMGSPEVTKVILENTDLIIQGDTLVGFASEDYNLKQVQALLNAGIDPDVMKDNQTALQRAVGNNNPKMTHLLLTYGADPEKKGEYGSALECAGHNELFTGMLESALKGEIKSPYYFIDFEMVKSRLNNWSKAMQIFAKQNKEHTFYVFGIDAGQLVGNSIEEFQKTLGENQKNFPDKYSQGDAIEKLKYNGGDFSFCISDPVEDTTETEEVILDFTFLELQENENRTEKELLRDGLIHNKEKIFKFLTVTDDFKIFAFGHVY